MPLTNSLVHPRMMRSLPTLFASRCTIGHETITQDESGQEVTTYPPDPSLANIPCYVEPLEGAGSGEIRRADQTIVENPYTIALQGYFPTIDQEDQAIVNGTDIYNILFVRHDDTRTLTFLDVEHVT